MLKHNENMEKSFLIWQNECALEHNCLGQQSLTRALKSLNAVFSVKLLHLGIHHDDVWLNDVFPQPQGFMRDVLLCLDDEPVVWARSRCAVDDAVWQAILNCGTQPLGERLFDGSLALSRTPFEYAFAPLLYDLTDISATAFAARRSVFELEGAKLGLVECFLPSLRQFWAK